MSEQTEPTPYSDRELTLKAISLTFQRAMAVQHELTGEPAFDIDAGDGADTATGASGSAKTIGPTTSDDRGADARSVTDDVSVDDVTGVDDNDVDDTDVDDTESGVNLEAGMEEADLPNPIVTDANFRHYLERATAFQGNAGHDRRLTGLKPGARQRRESDQLNYNAAVVNALHQLDHRTRLQQQTILKLEAELADARQALATLQSNELRPA